MKNKVYKAIKMSVLNANQKHALTGLVSFHFGNQTIYGSYAGLGKNWGMSPKTAQRAILYFENEIRLIDVKRRSGTSSVITIKVSMEELIDVLDNLEPPKSKPKINHGQPLEPDRSQIDTVVTQTDLGVIQVDLSKGQSDRGSGDSLTYNKEEHKEINKEEDKVVIKNSISLIVEDNQLDNYNNVEDDEIVIGGNSNISVSTDKDITTTPSGEYGSLEEMEARIDELKQKIASIPTYNLNVDYNNSRIVIQLIDDNIYDLSNVSLGLVDFTLPAEGVDETKYLVIKRTGSDKSSTGYTNIEVLNYYINYISETAALKAERGKLVSHLMGGFD